MNFRGLFRPGDAIGRRGRDQPWIVPLKGRRSTLEVVALNISACWPKSSMTAMSAALPPMLHARRIPPAARQEGGTSSGANQ